MKYIDLIGTDLKHDVLCDLFETYDVQVVYRYDRTHENLPDEYYAVIPDMGLEFVFDENQRLKTLFMEQIEITTFNPFEEDNRLKTFGSKSEAFRYASDNGVKIVEGKADFMGEKSDWIRFEYNDYSIHYKYVNSKLSRITLQKQNA